MIRDLGRLFSLASFFKSVALSANLRLQFNIGVASTVNQRGVFDGSALATEGRASLLLEKTVWCAGGAENCLGLPRWNGGNLSKRPPAYAAAFELRNSGLTGAVADGACHCTATLA